MFSKEAVTALREGGIAVIPTDTLYGIVGSAISKRTVERIYKVKGRDAKKAFIILIASISDLKKFGIELSLAQAKFLKKNWPNPLSVILSCPEKKFEYLHRGTRSLAFRVPKDESLRALLRKTGPLVAPSANLEGEEPAKTVKEAKAYFGDQIDIYISGPQKKGKASTVISLLGKNPEIVRQGAYKIHVDDNI